ncbi:PQQ-dependent sugar dehydrogenase [Flexithrix dorotheae]|uniref:PQQ-dependent sugar dehydrogenase n=1 Tax=Flexithrix dorotheae TaxID=70993 RepID=UPI00036C910A|nr:PQQ-dependent sugar dehydrogenase [Flexithrix dorotheae]
MFKLLLLPVILVGLSTLELYSFENIPDKKEAKINAFLPSSDFKDELVTSGLEQPTDIKFLPDGKALISQKNGEIYFIDPYTTSPKLSLFLKLQNINAQFERGLLTMAIDPSFSSNKYLYVYYSTADGRLRLSRFTSSGSTASLSSEFIVWQTATNYLNLAVHIYHIGGAMDISDDGKIFLVIGDLLEQDKAQDLKRYNGKLLRINKDGSVPTDNPFYNGGASTGPNGELKEIYAWGLRNPFKGHFDKVSKKFVMGEVGGNDHSKSWENIRYGIKGANYGWPHCGDANRDSNGNCTDPKYVDPVFAYKHIPNRGNSITGGFVYRGGNYPSNFQGVYFFADYAQSWIRYLEMDNNLNITAAGTGENRAKEFLSPKGTFGMVDIEQGPRGEIFYLMFNRNSVNTGEFRKIYYTKGNVSPIITKAIADKTTGKAPLTVKFTGEVSYSGSAALTYKWDFGDGTNANSLVATHIYSKSGTYKARFSVSVPGITVQSEEITIKTGQPPIVKITSPVNKSKFIAGQKIVFEGTATDDGPLSESNYIWQVLFLHNDHTHPFINSYAGKKGEFTIPKSGHSFQSSTGYIIVLTVKDSENLTTSEADTLYPQKSNVSFETVPVGLQVNLDGLPKSTPFVLDELVGFESQVNVASPQVLNGKNYQFVSWSDNGAKTHNISIPSSHTKLTAYFEETSLPVASFIEAEDVFQKKTDMGNNPIGKVYASILSKQSGVSIFDKNDKVGLSFNISTASKYQLKVRLRSGYNGNNKAYWPGGYSFNLDGNSITFTGIESTISSFSGELGGIYLGIMSSPEVHLSQGAHSLEIMANSSWGFIDYLELINLGSTEKSDPIANAGIDKTVFLPQNSVSIVGNGSDPDGGLVSFNWTQESGPGLATLTGKNASTLIVGSLIEGVYKFRLTVKDDENVSAFDEMLVTVKSSPSGGEVIQSLTLINTINNQPVSGYDPIATNAVINLQTLPSQNISIRANTARSVGSIKFNLSGFNGGLNHTQIESNAPYALFGDNAGNFHPWLPQKPAAGHQYDLLVNAYDQAGAKGNIIGAYAIKISFTSQNQSTDGGVIQGVSLINAANNQPIAGFDPIAQNAVINLNVLPSQQLNIRANTNSTGIGSLKFELKGSGGGTDHQKIESAAPYALFGDNAGNYNPWSPSAPKSGFNYNLSIKAYNQSGANGSEIGNFTISFSFSNGSSSARFVASKEEGNLFQEEVVIYPNPSSGEFFLNLNVLEFDQIEITIYNAIGQQFFFGSYTGPQQTKINLQEKGAVKGIYFARVTKNQQLLNNSKILVQ